MSKRDAHDPGSEQLMLGAAPGAEALGRGPIPDGD